MATNPNFPAWMQQGGDASWRPQTPTYNPTPYTPRFYQAPVLAPFRASQQPVMGQQGGGLVDAVGGQGAPQGDGTAPYAGQNLSGTEFSMNPGDANSTGISNGLGKGGGAVLGSLLLGSPLLGSLLGNALAGQTQSDAAMNNAAISARADGDPGMNGTPGDMGGGDAADGGAGALLGGDFGPGLGAEGGGGGGGGGK